jgi:hypothetical protein
MKLCPFCNSEIEDDAVYCDECGLKVTDKVEEPNTREYADENTTNVSEKSIATTDCEKSQIHTSAVEKGQLTVSDKGDKDSTPVESDNNNGKKEKKWSLVSLIMAIVTYGLTCTGILAILGLITSILGIVFGIKGMSTEKKGMAIAGLVISLSWYIFLILCILFASVLS